MSTPPAPLPDIPGIKFQELIGAGGAGVVFRAVHLALQRTVAVKLTLAPASNPAGGSESLREPQLMASLAHPHVVTVYDAGRVGEYCYLVMEYMPGGSLRSRMAFGHPWPLDRAAIVLDQIAAAVEHIHRQNVLHLDLKPENVLYSDDGQVKITDFGLSSLSHEPPVGRETPHQGTLDYAAPERLAGAVPDPRFDVFSLASIAYELLTGRIPGRVHVPAARRNPRLPATLDDVFRRGLARDPQQRYASVAEFRRALSVASRSRTRMARVGLAIVAAALMVALTVLFVVWWRISTSTVSLPPADRPTRLWVLYDQPADLSMFATDGGTDRADDPGVAVENLRVEVPPQHVPSELPLPYWPTPRPVLAIRSEQAWGFVYPFRDQDLGHRVVRNWPTLLRMTVPPGKNFVKSGGFDGDCLAMTHLGELWRARGAEDWSETLRITLEQPPDRPGDPALRLTNLTPPQNKSLLGCYQPISRWGEPREVVVLRYRARARDGTGKLAVYAGMPVDLPDHETGPAAERVRRVAERLSHDPRVFEPPRWQYRCPTWVVPTTDWQTYMVVVESPPFLTRTLHRNLVIDLAARGEVWVDDVELFVWRSRGEP